MYIKRIFLVIALLGLVVAGYFANFVYRAMIRPNTAFNNELAYIYISTDANYQMVRNELEPLLDDIDSFDDLAKKKQYINNIKAGRYAIRKGMNNNDIINTIRSKNLPIKVSFNNINSLEKLAGKIGQEIEADSLSLLQAMTDETFLKESGFNEATALGMYLPNSYEFFWNTSAEAFRTRMLREYKSFWNESRVQKTAESHYRYSVQ